jgi:hypothetical protein
MPRAEKTRIPSQDRITCGTVKAQPLPAGLFCFMIKPMAMFEVPDDLAEFLEERANAENCANAQELVVSLLDRYRDRIRGPRREPRMADSYGQS